ncbi:MAG: phage tail protein [Succinivibrio dextrinosolvens]|nr:phage tail protein [Succinivibrio dextrinosolvens]
MVQPNKWGEVLGYNADYNQLPEDATLTASFSKLFPEITQIPLEVGGTPPKRMDLNAIFKLIGENVFYYQNGGVFEYNDNFRYEAGNVIRFNNKIFLCIRENSRTNKHAPNDATYWQQITTNDILRNYVKSVNGITPDANGNVSFSYVKYTDLTPYAKRTELEPKADRSELAPLATKSEVEIACPVGTVHAFAGVYAPNGWLLCNGQAVSRSQFSRLFSVISTRYGGGDGYSTFNVPDMRDRFIEGAHSYNVGTPLNAGIPNITGTTQTNDDTSAVGGAFRVERAFGTDRYATLWYQLINEYQVSFDASRSSAVYGRSSTVQPNALNMNFIIKY